jgi:hypothetical protein
MVWLGLAAIILATLGLVGFVAIVIVQACRSMLAGDPDGAEVKRDDDP